MADYSKGCFETQKCSTVGERAVADRKNKCENTAFFLPSDATFLIKTSDKGEYSMNDSSYSIPN